MEAVIIYWSNTGNTEKVALAVQEGLSEAGMTVSLRRVEDAGDIDFFAYDLVCIGFPSYQWSPPKLMDDFLKRKFSAYRPEEYHQVGSANRVREKRSYFLHLLQIIIQASARPFRPVFMPVSFSSTWDLTFLMSGM